MSSTGDLVGSQQQMITPLGLIMSPTLRSQWQYMKKEFQKTNSAAETLTFENGVLSIDMEKLTRFNVVLLEEAMLDAYLARYSKHFYHGEGRVVQLRLHGSEGSGLIGYSLLGILLRLNAMRALHIENTEVIQGNTLWKSFDDCIHYTRLPDYDSDDSDDEESSSDGRKGCGIQLPFLRTIHLQDITCDETRFTDGLVAGLCRMSPNLDTLKLIRSNCGVQKQSVCNKFELEVDFELFDIIGTVCPHIRHLHIDCGPSTRSLPQDDGAQCIPVARILHLLSKLQFLEELHIAGCELDVPEFLRQLNVHCRALQWLDLDVDIGMPPGKEDTVDDGDASGSSSSTVTASAKGVAKGKRSKAMEYLSKKNKVRAQAEAKQKQQQLPWFPNLITVSMCVELAETPEEVEPLFAALEAQVDAWSTACPNLGNILLKGLPTVEELKVILSSEGNQGHQEMLWNLMAHPMTSSAIPVAYKEVVNMDNPWLTAQLALEREVLANDEFGLDDNFAMYPLRVEDFGRHEECARLGLAVRTDAPRETEGGND